MASAMIGYAESDGGGEMIRLHYYGEPSYAGRILSRHYGSRAQALDLCRLGNLATLGPTLDTAPWRDPVDATRAYCRDRNDPWDEEAPQRFSGGLSEVAGMDWQGGRYVYIHTDAGWLYMSDDTVARPTHGWKPLPAPRSRAARNAAA